MAQTIELKVEPRGEAGKEKVKALRRAGYVPANVYGQGVESIPIKVEAKALEDLLNHATASTIVDIRVGGKTRHCLLRDVQYGAVRREPLHVDFFAVPLNRRVKAVVPLVMHGESPAAKSKELILLHPVSQVQLEGRPGDLPESVEVDVTGLTDVDQAIHARDLVLPENVTLLDDPDEIVVKVQMVKGAVEADTALAEEAAVGTAEGAAQGAAAEGESAAGGNETPGAAT